MTQPLTDYECIEAIRKLAEDTIAKGQTAARKFGDAGAFLAVARSRLAEQFLALLPPEGPR